MKIKLKVFFILILLLVFKTFRLNACTGEASAFPVYDDKELPNWIFENNVSIGISDVQMDSVTAVNQAINRALAIYALGNTTNIGSVYELYYLVENDNSKILDNQKSHWMAIINADLNNYNYEIKNIYYSEYYKEAFVSLSVFYDINSNKKLSVNGKFMFYYDYQSNKCEYGESDTLMIHTPSETINYSLWVSKISNSKDFKESIIDGTIVKILDYDCKYSDCGSSCPNAPFANQKYGLWNAFIDTYIQAISNFESNGKLIKKTSQSITKEYEKYSDKNQNIVRSVMKTKLTCSYNTISLKDKNMYVDWKIEEK